MPMTKEGVQRLLEFFIYGIIRAAESLGTAEPFVRAMEEEGLRKFMPVNMPRFQAPRDAVSACKAYTAEVDRMGIMDTSDTAIRGNDKTVELEIGEKCVYRRVCTMRHDEGLPVHCIRGVALSEMLRIRLGADYDWDLEAFGLPCRGRLSRTDWR